jgi:hypothetical protein
MRKRWTVCLAGVLATLGATCDYSTTPSPIRTTYIVELATSGVALQPNGDEVNVRGAAQIALSRPAIVTAATKGFIDVLIELSGVPSQMTVTDVHLHIGRRGETGPMILTVPTGRISRTAGRLEIDAQSIEVDAGLVQSTESSPEILYLDVHSAANPAGALRGQLTPTP